jgi:hypothetical protein
MFYLPGEATRDQLKHLIERYLRDIIVFATNRTPEVWRITNHGIEPFVPRKPRKRSH